MVQGRRAGWAVSMSRPDFDTINSVAAADRLSLLRKWFPNGRLNGHEFEVGDLQGNPGRSLKINVQTGKWKDFNTGESGGDMISLYAAIHKLKQGEAAMMLAQELGIADDTQPPRRAAKPKWTPVTPAPEDARGPYIVASLTSSSVLLWPS